MSVQRSLSTVFKSLQKALDYPIPLLSSGAFSPASISGLRSRLLDANTFTSPIDSKYYLCDTTVENIHLPRQGRCWLFDGSDDFAVGPQLTSSQFTASLWIKPSTQATGTQRAIIAEYDTNFRFVVFRDATTPSVVAIQVYTFGSSNFRFISSSGVLVDGVWTHLAVTVSSSGTVALYINGVSVSLTLSSGVPGAITSSAAAFRLATLNGSLWPLNASLRDVRIYSSAKTAGEVSAIYNQSLTGIGTFDTTGLLAAYPCNEESGTTGYDISGNGKHLTLTNITQATFHAADTGVLANRNNAEGYRLGVNLTKYSEDLTNSVWSFANIGSVTVANQTTAPDGAVSADLVREDTSTGSHRLWRYENPVLTTGVRYTFSIYLKASGRTKIEFAGDSIFTVDLVAETNTNGTITSIGNGWYRVSSTFVATGTVSSHYCLLNNGSTNSYTGDGSSGMYIWGGQVEVGSIATTYQPTQSTGIAGRYIPKRLSSSLAADGNALTVTGRAAYHGCAEPPCVTGNGSSVYVDLGSPLIPATADFDLTLMYYHATGNTTRRSIFFQSNISDTLFVGMAANDNAGVGTANRLTLFLNAVGALLPDSLVPGAWNTLRLARTGNSWSSWLNGALQSTTTNSFSVTSGYNTTLLAYKSSAAAVFSDGSVADFRITTGGVTTYFPLQDGPGSSNTNRDLAYVKSDETGGVRSSAIINGTVSTIWGNRVPGNVEDWCVKYGGRIAANGAFVAGMVSGGNAADGSAKTLTAGKFGNPFSRLNLNPATAAELNGKNIQTAYEDLPCVTGNGSNVYFSLGSLRIPVGDHTVSFWYYHEQSNTTSRRLFDVRVGSFLYIVIANHGVADRIVFYGKSVTFGSIDGLVVNAWNLITLTQASSSITCTLTKPDGSQVVSSPIAVVGEVDTSPIYLLGAYNNSGVPTLANPSAGRIANVSLTASGATTCFPLSDGSGADLAWYKSDGTKGVVSTALQGTLTNVWANKTNGSKVAATKYALRAIVTRETEFNRVASDGDDRFLIYDNALSGADLTNIEGYLA